MHGRHERPMSEEDARNVPGATVFNLEREDGRRETRIMARDGDDLLMYDFVAKRWERLESTADQCVMVEDRWRKILEDN